MKTSITGFSFGKIFEPRTLTDDRYEWFAQHLEILQKIVKINKGE